MTYSKLYTSPQTFPIRLVTETGQAVQISIRLPSRFIAQNLERVIPNWNLPVVWVVVIWQQSRYKLVETTPHIEREKERLREKFIRFGLEVVFKLRDRGFLTDLIDPRSGYPLLSCSGQISHDDTAVVKALLGLPITHNSCRILEHYEWGTAVYPSIMISSASPTIIKSVLKRVATQHSWKQQQTDCQLCITEV